MNISIPEHILTIKAYSPGKPMEELQREMGVSRTIKLASNENPLGPSPLAVKAMEASLQNVHRYPDSRGYNLVQKLSDRLDVEPEHIVIGNGSDELIGILAQALLQPGDEAIAATPSFLMYDIMVRAAGAALKAVPLENFTLDLAGFAKAVTDKTRLIFVCNPNNPTGTVFTKSTFEWFLKEIPPNIVVVMDEAYIDFVRDDNAPDGIDYFEPDRPLIVLRTFSKAYGLAGLRIGYGVMPETISDLVHRIRHPFNSNILGQAAAAAALDDHAFLKKTIQLTHEGLDYFYETLTQMELAFVETQTNFLLIDVEKDAGEVYRELLKLGVIVRSMTAYDYPSYLRVNVGLPEENRTFIEALKKVLS